MKGVPGLLIAAALGLIGAFCNFLYIARVGATKESVSFLAVKADTTVNPGERFAEHHFTQVDIPKDNLGRLHNSGILYKDRITVYGIASTKPYQGGEILLRQDLKTKGQKSAAELLGANEDGKWIAVDTRTFVPDRVNAGDMVSFTVPEFAQAQSRSEDASFRQPSAMVTLGPFRIIALGSRTGRAEVTKAAGGGSGSEYNLLVALERRPDGTFGGDGARLVELIRKAGYQPVEATLHSSRMKVKP